MLLCILFAWIAPYVFQIPPDILHEVRWSILIVGIGAALKFPFFVYSAVFPATQRYDYANAIGIVTRLIQAAGVVAALSLELGLIGVSLAIFAANFVDYMIRRSLHANCCRRLRISPRLGDLHSLKSFCRLPSGLRLSTSANRLLAILRHRLDRPCSCRWPPFPTTRWRQPWLLISGRSWVRPRWFFFPRPRNYTHPEDLGSCRRCT